MPHKQTTRQAAEPRPKCSGAFRRIDDWDRRLLRPAKSSPGVQRLQNRLCDGNLAPKRWMHRVLKQLVIQKAMATDRMKVRLCVNKNAVVSRCDFAVDLLEVGQTAHRIAVSIPGRDVVMIGLVPRFFCSSSRARR